MNFVTTFDYIYTIRPVNIGFNFTSLGINSRYITLEFYPHKRVDIKVVEVSRDNSTKVVYDNNIWISNNVSGMFADILAVPPTSVTEATNLMLDYIMKNEILVRSGLVKDLEGYFPGYTALFLDTITESIKEDVHAEIMGEFGNDEFRSKTLNDVILEVFSNYPDMDDNTKREIMRDAQQELQRIKSRLEANIKTAKKSTNEAIHAYILRAMVSSQQRY